MQPEIVERDVREHMVHRPHARARPRVLIVDDSTTNRELLRAVLEEDVEIHEAPDGATALRLAASLDVDLILLDVMMPDLSGYEVCQRLRATRGEEHLPILLLTGLTEESDRVRGFRAGADDFITKPINTVELRLRVHAFLRSRRLYLERQALLDDLQRVHDLKDDLFAMLVHDLRNPLTGLAAHLELLEMLELASDAQNSIRAARFASERIRDLVEDLLQVRLLEDGALTIGRERHDLGRIVQEAVRTMEGAAQAKQGLLLVDLDPSTPVVCDPALVRRALENLLANAIRHSPAGAKVTTRLRATGGAVTLTVEDYGPGIPEEQRALLFTKYGSVALRRGGLRTGHGLGLYLVSEVMRAHEGYAHVDEAYHEGTRVAMVFPQAEGTPHE